MAVINSYSWSSFKALKGTPKYATGLINGNSGDEFTALAFEHPTERTSDGKPSVCFVSFAQKLGVLTPQQLKARINELQIVENEEHRFTLCEMGENSGWEVLNF